jgi:hypothetical protein
MRRARRAAGRGGRGGSCRDAVDVVVAVDEDRLPCARSRGGRAPSRRHAREGGGRGARRPRLEVVARELRIGDAAYDEQRRRDVRDPVRARERRDRQGIGRAELPRRASEHGRGHDVRGGYGIGGAGAERSASSFDGSRADVLVFAHAARPAVPAVAHDARSRIPRLGTHVCTRGPRSPWRFSSRPCRSIQSNRVRGAPSSLVGNSQP